MSNEVVTIEVPKVGKFNVSARMKCESRGCGQFNNWHYIFTLRIWTDKGEMRCSYHDSTYNYCKHVKKLEREELLNALDCILSDISMYLNDEIKGCYDEYEEAAELRRVERGCQSEYERFQSIIGDVDIWDVIEFLTEYINENR